MELTTLVIKGAIKMVFCARARIAGGGGGLRLTANCRALGARAG